MQVSLGKGRVLSDPKITGGLSKVWGKGGYEEMCIFKIHSTGVPLLHRGIRIWHCHCRGLAPYGGAGLILGLGTSTCHGVSQKNFLMKKLNWVKIKIRNKLTLARGLESELRAGRRVLSRRGVGGIRAGI